MILILNNLALIIGYSIFTLLGLSGILLFIYETDQLQKKIHYRKIVKKDLKQRRKKFKSIIKKAA